MALNAFNDEYCDKFEGIHGELPHGKQFRVRLCACTMSLF